MQPTSKKLLNQVREAIRFTHYSFRAENSYWRQPLTMSPCGICLHSAQAKLTAGRR